MPISQTLVNRGTLRPQRKVVAELGLKPAFPGSQFGPCSAESAALSPPEARAPPGPPAPWFGGGGVAQCLRGGGAWTLGKGPAPGCSGHWAGARGRRQDSQAQGVGIASWEGHHALQDYTFTCSGARGKAEATLDATVPTQGLSTICLQEAFVPADPGGLELGRSVPG